MGIFSPLIILGSAAIGILGLALIPFTYALSLLQGVGMDTIISAATALEMFATRAAVMGVFSPLIILGSAAIAVLGLALIPFTYALSLLQGIGFDSITGAADALSTFATQAAIMGIVSPLIIAGSIAIGILGIGLMPFIEALSQLQGVGVDNIKATAEALSTFATEAAVMGIFAIPIMLGSVAIAALGFGLRPFIETLSLLQGIGTDVITSTATALSFFAKEAAIMGILAIPIMLGSAAIAVLGYGLRPFIETLGLLQGIGIDSITGVANALSTFATEAAVMGAFAPLIIVGSAAISILGIGLMPFIAALSLLQGIGFDSITGAANALATFAQQAAVMGMFAPLIIIGSAAIAVLGIGLMPFIGALNLLQDIGFDSIMGAANALAIFAQQAAVMGIFSPLIILGSVAIGTLGLALIPFAFALSLLQGVGLESIITASTALSIFAQQAAVMGIFAPLIVVGSLAIGALGLALIPFASALSLLQGLGMESILVAADALAMFAEKAAIMGIFAPLIIAGSTAIGFLGMGLIPFAAALSILQGVGTDNIGSIAEALSLFAEQAAILGIFAPAIIFGSLAIQILGISLMAFTSALAALQGVDPSTITSLSANLISLSNVATQMGENAASIMLGSISIYLLGRSLTKLGEGLNSVANGGEKAIDIISRLESMDTTKLYNIAPALKSVKEGLDTLNSGGGIMDLFKSDPVEQIERLAATSSGLQIVGNALQTIASAIVNLNASLSSLDMTKLEKLAEMSSGSSISSFIGGLMDTITGNELKTETTPISTPITTGVTAEVSTESVQSSVDLTPLVTAINEVRVAVDRLYGKNTTINMDGTTVGTTLTKGSYLSA